MGFKTIDDGQDWGLLAEQSMRRLGQNWRCLEDIQHTLHILSRRIDEPSDSPIAINLTPNEIATLADACEFAIADEKSGTGVYTDDSQPADIEPDLAEGQGP